jgi:16S rRNA U516 pseudouridylate synthase RsuA-like enzyme
MVRLQKFLAEAGVASRRASEQIILGGRVAVNGHTIDGALSKPRPVTAANRTESRACRR